MDFESELQLARTQFGPAWRWQEALCRAEAGDDSLIRCPILMKILDYVRLSTRFGWGYRRLPPRLHLFRTAHELEQRPDMAETARIHTLSRRPVAEVAQRVGVSEEALACWRQMFFDVTANLDASGWILAQVIAPEEAAGHPERAGRYRFAYFGKSPVAAEPSVSPAPSGSPRDELLWAALAFRTEHALNQALSTPATAQKLIKAFLEVRRLEIARDREIERRQREEAVAIRRHEIDMKDLELRKALTERDTARELYRQAGDTRYVQPT